MDRLGLALLALAAIAMAANQALKDAPVLTAKLQWLRPRGWWNYAPLCFLLLAMGAYGLSWLGGGRTEFIPVALATESEKSGSTSADPNVLPRSVSENYVALVAEGRTDLQEQRFLKEHAGKTLELQLPLIGFERDGDRLRGQFYAGTRPEVFVLFLPEWEDYLLDKNVGDEVRFRAKVVETERGFQLAEARPL